MSTEMSDATLFRTEQVHPTVKSTSANAIVLPAFRAANGPKRRVAHDGQGGYFVQEVRECVTRAANCDPKPH